MKNDSLEPSNILAAFTMTGAVRILEPWEVAAVFAMHPNDHPRRYKALCTRLRLMARAGWLAEMTDEDGVLRYMPAHSMQLAVPPGLVEYLEGAINELLHPVRLVRFGEATIPAGSPVGVDADGNLLAYMRPPDAEGTLVAPLEDRTTELLRNAINERCTCGGGGPNECCTACDIWHAVMDGR